MRKKSQFIKVPNRESDQTRLDWGSGNFDPQLVFSLEGCSNFMAGDGTLADQPIGLLQTQLKEVENGLKIKDVKKSDP